MNVLLLYKICSISVTLSNSQCNFKIYLSSLADILVLQHVHRTLLGQWFDSSKH